MCMKYRHEHLGFLILINYVERCRPKLDKQMKDDAQDKGQIRERL